MKKRLIQMMPRRNPQMIVLMEMIPATVIIPTQKPETPI
jgi:hypothetical protein